MAKDASTLPRVGKASTSVVLTVVFFALALWFLVGPNLARVPRIDPAVVEASDLGIGPIRSMQSSPPIVFLGGFDRHCMDCHRFFQPERESARQLVQHMHIVMDHGLNDRCANCHDRVNANRLALRGEETVSFDESAELCAKCHGPTYRDWQHGMHGKTTGYWDRSRGDPLRFTCVECHDPHAPAFAPMRPLPGPNTLRMVLTQPHEGAHVSPLEQADPLRKWHYDKPKLYSPVELPLVAPAETGDDHVEGDE